MSETFDFRTSGPAPKEYFGWCARLYKKGFAIGQPDIKADEIVFRYKDEIFVFEAADAAPLCEIYGTFYTMKIASLRKLKRRKNG